MFLVFIKLQGFTVPTESLGYGQGQNRLFIALRVWHAVTRVLVGISIDSIDKKHKIL